MGLRLSNAKRESKLVGGLVITPRMTLQALDLSLGQFFVHLVVKSCYPLPRERARRRDAPLDQRRIGLERAEDPVRELVRFGGDEDDGTTIRDLLDGRSGSSDYRAAAGHCLENRQSEPFVPARKDDSGRTAIERRELFDGHDASPPHTCGQRQPVLTAACEHQLELGPASPHARERLEQYGMVLVRPGACRVEKERLARAAVRAIDGGVDSVMDDADAPWVKPEMVYRAIARERAGDDHPIGATGCPIVREPPKEPYAMRYKLRKVEVQQIVQCYDARLRRRREGDRQRVMDDVGSSERAASKSGMEEGRRTRASRRHTRADEGKASANVGRVGRRHDEVIARPILRKRKRETACIRFRTAHATRGEGEQRDPDHPVDSVPPPARYPSRRKGEARLSASPR
jgi:hypothetical protein